MLFGMFFGAGNLIFPVHMGQMAGANSLPAIIGFIITGVGLPLLGVAAMGISRSEGLREMAGRVGKGYAVFFTCALYLTIGPFFAIPRCATTSFTVGIESMLPAESVRLALLAFTAVFFALVLIFSLKPGRIVTVVGKVINPAFLVFLLALIVISLLKPMGSVAEAVPDGTYTDGAFFNGFLEGYNTMDALASLAFGIVVIRVIRDMKVTEPEAVAGNTVKAGFFSCLLMAVIYALMTVMGAQSRGLFEISENGGIALSQISSHYFGGLGQFFLAVTVTLACLKTSIGLVTSCAETFAEMFPKVRYRAWVIIFSLFPLLVANVGLTSLITYSIPVLMFLYPLAITLILLSLFGKFFGYDKRVFVSVTAFTLVAALFDFIAALPEGIRTAIRADAISGFAEKVLPFYSLGLGWIVPALVGLGIGLLLHFTGKKGGQDAQQA